VRELPNLDPDDTRPVNQRIARPFVARGTFALVTAQAKTIESLTVRLDAVEIENAELRFWPAARDRYAVRARWLVWLPRPASRAVELAYRMGVHGTDPREP
jgi:hypothetical protein